MPPDQWHLRDFHRTVLDEFCALLSGGVTWMSYARPAESGCVPGGNPAPDYAIGVPRRGQESLYRLAGLVVLDAKTGDDKRHFKIVRKDCHNYNVCLPILARCW
jgi:alcohol dehydrogenase (cytochrome c)